MSSPRLAVFAGTFDPVTNGHLDIVGRSLAVFDRVVVAALVNTGKQPLFTLEERVAMLRASLAKWPAVEVDTFDGLLVDYMQKRNAAAVIRGVRSAPEFAEESQMALMNRHLFSGCETVFFSSSAEHLHISSRLVREIVHLGGSVAGLVPAPVEDALRARRPSR
jgi:pantetheine-phosphate adenylyltransferase